MSVEDDEGVSALTPDEMQRAMTQILTAAGETGMTREDLFRGVDLLDEMAFGAVMWHMWQGGTLTIALSPDRSELLWSTLT